MQDSRKHILHCISRLKAGGAQTQLILLCNYTDFSKYKVSILCWDGIVEGLHLLPEVNIITVKKGKGWAFLKLWKAIYMAIKNTKPDLIQIWLPELMAIPASIAGFSLNIPVVSCERRVPTDVFNVLWIRDRLKYIAHLFGTVVVPNFPLPTKKKISLFNWIYHRKHGQIIFNGLELQKFEAVLANTPPKENTGFFELVYAGRLAKQKNVDLLLKALDMVLKKGLKVRLHIFGKGTEEERIRLIGKELGLVQNLIFYGYLPDWQKYVVGYHAIVLPSNLEGMPNVLFEGVAMQLPVIASDIPEVAAHFTNRIDSLLVTPNEVEPLAIAIECLYNDPALCEAMNAAANISVKKYDIRTMVSSYEALYGQLIAAITK